MLSLGSCKKSFSLWGGKPRIALTEMHNPWAFTLGVVVASGWPWPMSHFQGPEEVDLGGLFQPSRPPAVHHEVEEGGNMTNQTENKSQEEIDQCANHMEAIFFFAFIWC